MKKTTFYTLVKEDNQIIIRLQRGWTDGKYNYYKIQGGRTWFAIDPKTGRSLTVGNSRKFVIEDVYSDYMQTRISDFAKTNKYIEMVNEFMGMLKNS